MSRGQQGGDKQIQDCGQEQSQYLTFMPDLIEDGLKLQYIHCTY